MVVTIIGIVAAIAVPRMSTVTTRASADALRATLAAVRRAIDCFYAEHGKYPGYKPSNAAPSGNEFVAQLTIYTDLRGTSSPAYGYPFIFGPYLRAPFPANPINGLSTVHVKATPLAPEPANGSVGWVAVLSDGSFGVSATDTQLEEVGIRKPNDKSTVRAVATD